MAKQFCENGGVPVGTVISYFSAKDEHDNYIVPFGYLACDGSQYNQADYPALAALLTAIDSTTFGSPGATHFNVPDLRGEFLRGTGTNSHTNQGSGANVGTHQDATNHIHVTVDDNNFWLWGDTTNPSGATNEDSMHSYYNRLYGGNNHVDGYTGNSKFYTARPTNTSVLYCIKY